MAFIRKRLEAFRRHERKRRENAHRVGLRIVDGNHVPNHVGRSASEALDHAHRSAVAQTVAIRAKARPVSEVRRFDHERLAFPMTAGVARVLLEVVAEVRTSIERDHTRVVNRRCGLPTRSTAPGPRPVAVADADRHHREVGGRRRAAGRRQGRTGPDRLGAGRLADQAGSDRARARVPRPGAAGEERHRVDDDQHPERLHQGHLDHVDGSEAERARRHASHLHLVQPAPAELAVLRDELRRIAARRRRRGHRSQRRRGGRTAATAARS